jgi:hypothetical protein
MSVTEEGDRAGVKPELGAEIKTAFERAKDEHGVSRRAVAAAVFARQNSAYQLRRRNAPQHALAALPSAPRSVHSWENLYLRWFTKEDFPVRKDLIVVLDALDSLAPGSSDHHTRAEWLRMWQAGPSERPDSAPSEAGNDPDASPETAPTEAPRPAAVNQVGRDMIIYGGQYNSPGDLTIIHERSDRPRKD